MFLIARSQASERWKRNLVHKQNYTHVTGCQVLACRASEGDTNLFLAKTHHEAKYAENCCRLKGSPSFNFV